MNIYLDNQSIQTMLVEIGSDEDRKDDYSGGGRHAGSWMK